MTTLRSMQRNTATSGCVGSSMKVGSLVRYKNYARVANGHRCLTAFFIVVEVESFCDKGEWVRIQSTRDIGFSLPEQVSCLELISEGR
jgi:hypothetical protein